MIDRRLEARRSFETIYGEQAEDFNGHVRAGLNITAGNVSSQEMKAEETRRGAMTLWLKKRKITH